MSPDNANPMQIRRSIVSSIYCPEHLLILSSSCQGKAEQEFYLVKSNPDAQS